MQYRTSPILARRDMCGCSKSDDAEEMNQKITMSISYRNLDETNLFQSSVSSEFEGQRLQLHPFLLRYHHEQQ